MRSYGLAGACKEGGRPFDRSITIKRNNNTISVTMSVTFTAKQKHEVITKLTDAMVSIEGENMRSVTWVIIEEVRSGEWGIGGQALTTKAVQALALGSK